MVKKILVLLLALIMILCSGFAFTACKNSVPPDDTGGIETPGDNTDGSEEPGVDPEEPGTEEPGTGEGETDGGEDGGDNGGGTFQGNPPSNPNREDSYDAT